VCTCTCTCILSSSLLTLQKKLALHLFHVVGLRGVLIAGLHHTRGCHVLVQYFRWVLRVPAVFDTTVITGHCELMFGFEPTQTFPVIISVKFQLTDSVVLYTFCFIQMHLGRSSVFLMLSVLVLGWLSIISRDNYYYGECDIIESNTGC
jgi:hypothetical protein